VKKNSSFPRFAFVALVLSLAIGQPTVAQPAPRDLQLGPESRAITYIIALTDRLRVAIFQENDLSTISRVDSKGRVNLPLVGPVSVVGMTVEQAQETIQIAYQDKRFLRNPQVTITVEEYASREVIVQGEVVAPGRIPLPIESGMTVLDVITKAGGFNDVAKGKAVKVTRTLPDGTKEVTIVDVASALIGKESTTEVKPTMLLLPGDIVFVPIALF
jgi:polysaccharide export outer membrane protein